MDRIFKGSFGLGLATANLATAAFAGSHSDKAAKDAVAARHAQMQIVSYSTGILGAMAKGEVEFDAALASSAATNLNAMAKLDLATLWVPGTEQGAIDGSRAKAEVWSDSAGFVEKFAALEKASADMMGAADVDAVNTGIGAIGAACKACHETYRGPKN